MSTKKFVWKDRNTAAVDLIQLTYHAPATISGRSLSLLSAIRSDAVIEDLKAISLDFLRPDWDQVYAIRALAEMRTSVYFPELISIVDHDGLKRKQIIEKRALDNESLASLYFHDDRIGTVISFVARHPENEGWLFDAMARMDARVRYTVLVEWIGGQGAGNLADKFADQLLSLVETIPELLTLDAVNRLYDYYEKKPLVQTYLRKHIGAIAIKAIDAQASNNSSFKLDSSVCWEWLELRTEIFRLRPDYEEIYLRDQAQRNSERDEWNAQPTENESYKETAIWQELVELQQKAETDPKAIWALYKKIYNKRLSIPARAAAAHLLGKLNHHPSVVEKLRHLASFAEDTWDDLAPVRFEASKALFEVATPQSWECLVEAYLFASNNLLILDLRMWIAWLTDLLSGVDEPFEETDHGVEQCWQIALAQESAG